MEIELDDVTLLRNAANTLIKFYNEAIAVAGRFTAAEKEYDEITDRINPNVLVYGKVHDVLACKMGTNTFLNHEEMKAIRKRVRSVWVLSRIDSLAKLP